MFAIVAPLLIGANVLYGTLGTLFAALAWLNLLATVLLMGPPGSDPDAQRR